MGIIRKTELDFLRGIAIILVVFFHFDVIIPFGWIAVDLFFVLSGYLISTLLFTEFQKNNTVNIKRFLIRRGFKLYPLFYFFILVTVIIKLLMKEELSLKLLLYESTFTRNYFGGFWAHTWSLCVEEHFYILFAFIIFLVCNKTKYIHHIKTINSCLIFIFIVSLCLRIFSVFMERYYGQNHFFNPWARFAHTHHRMDSILFGVFIAYNLSFNAKKTIAFYQKNRKILLYSALILITTVVAFMKIDVFKTTISLTFLFIAFGIILTDFLLNNPLGTIRSKWLSKLISVTALIGCNSYAIYLWHNLIRDYVANNPYILNHTNFFVQFLIYIILSISVGYLTTKYVENYFLKIREKVAK